MNRLVPLSQLSAEVQRAAAAAVEAQVAAYAPYSLFGVGAALLHHDGTVTAGCNYENCTYQACCAERCAIVRANVEGRRTARAVSIYGGPLGEAAAATADPDKLCPPCGLCRQLLVEVADLSSNFESFEVILVSRDKAQAAVLTLAELMPMPFGPSDVGIDVTKYRDVPSVK